MKFIIMPIDVIYELYIQARRYKRDPKRIHPEKTQMGI